MALVPGNPVIAGTVLVRAAIQSPNFSAVAFTGWSIDQNGNAFFYSLTVGGVLTLTETPEINFPLGSFISENATGVLVLGGSPGVNAINPLMPFKDNIAAVTPGTLATEETWHTIAAASFTAGFAAGIPAARFQLEPIGGGRVRLAGSVVLTANQIANTTMFTLPAGYVPTAASQTFVTQNNLSGYAAGDGVVTVTSTGAVQMGPAGTNGDFLRLDGICFELD